MPKRKVLICQGPCGLPIFNARHKDQKYCKACGRLMSDKYVKDYNREKNEKRRNQKQG